MTSQPGYQRARKRILFNISQSEDNETITFGQLIEYNNRNIFLSASCIK